MPQVLITDDIRAALLANGNASADTPGGVDHKPVVKLFTPDGAATWLLSELDPHNPEIAFGLCDLGMGEPEIGSVYLGEIMELRGRLGLPVERDEHFEALLTVSQYATRARRHGIVQTDLIHREMREDGTLPVAGG